MFLELVISILLIIGGFFALVGSVGMLRMPDFLSRLHAPAKITTIAIGSLLLASMGAAYHLRGEISTQELIITLFIFMTAPITAHLLSKAAVHLELPLSDKTKNASMNDEIKKWVD